MQQGLALHILPGSGSVYSEYQSSQGNKLGRVTEASWAAPAAANVDTALSTHPSIPWCVRDPNCVACLEPPRIHQEGPCHLTERRLEKAQR